MDEDEDEEASEVLRPWFMDSVMEEGWKTVLLFVVPPLLIMKLLLFPDSRCCCCCFICWSELNVDEVWLDWKALGSCCCWCCGKYCLCWDWLCSNWVWALVLTGGCCWCCGKAANGRDVFGGIAGVSCKKKQGDFVFKALGHKLREVVQKHEDLKQNHETCYNKSNLAGENLPDCMEGQFTFWFHY